MVMERLFRFSLVLSFVSSSCLSDLSVKNTCQDTQGLLRLTTDPGDQYSPKFSNHGRYLAYISTEHNHQDIVIYDFQEKEKARVTNSADDNEDIEWSPDDNLLSFTSYSKGIPSVKMYRLSDGTITTVSDAEQRASDAKWSPAGDQLVMDFNLDGKDLWLFDLASSEFTQLTLMKGDERNFGFSQDGDWVGFSSRGSDFPHLQAYHLKTGEIRQLVGNESGFEWHPVWSKKRFEVLFYSTWNNEMTDVWVTSGAAENLQRITYKNIEEFGPAFNHDEDLIAYFSWEEANDIRIYDRISVEFKDLELRRDLIVKWNPLSWSPTRNTLAFVGVHEKDRLYQVSLDGGAQKLFLPERPENYETHPDIDASGDWMVFSENKNIVVRGINTGNEVVIAPAKDYQSDIFPSWVPGLPDKIAFLHGEGGASDTNNIWIMDQDGGDKRQLTDIGGIVDYCWIDHDNLVFSYDPTTSYGNYDIWTLEISSNTYRPLVQDAGATLHASSVSPDGKVLLFSGDFDGTDKIYKTNLDRPGNHEEIVGAMNGGSEPTFSNSGKMIAFLSNQNHEKYHDVYVISERGGEAKRITNSPEREYGIRWMPGDASLLFSANKGNNDIYLVDIDKRLKKDDLQSANLQ